MQRAMPYRAAPSTSRASALTAVIDGPRRTVECSRRCLGEISSICCVVGRQVRRGACGRIGLALTRALRLGPFPAGAFDLFEPDSESEFADVVSEIVVVVVTFREVLHQVGDAIGDRVELVLQNSQTRSDQAVQHKLSISPRTASRHYSTK